MYKSQILVITYKLARQLAKSNKYQNLYSQYKECGVRIFKNDCEHTDYQIFFMNYLRFYANLNMDVHMGDVDKIVLENDIYEDSYSYYKSKSKIKDKLNNKQPQQNKRPGPTRTDMPSKSSTHILFNKPNLKGAVTKAKNRRK